MPIFTRLVEEVLPLVPSVFRRGPLVALDDDAGTLTSRNIRNLWTALLYQFLDASSAALEEFASTSYPLATASGWVLEQHWGPLHNLQRNGLSDADYRLYILAKRYLNRSWGAADQVLQILALLLPAATLEWVPHYPKAWEVIITGVDMATAAPALAFLRKNPSPLGGGFSVAGDNGIATVSDLAVLSYSSVHGAVPITGGFGSIYGAGGGAQAGYAHAAPI